MATKNFMYSSVFKELTKMVQLRFDAASETNKKIFDNVLFEKYLRWDNPSIGLDFEEIIGQYNISIAAPTIGDNSKEAILGTEGLKTLKERVLNHAITLPMTIQEYRRILALQESTLLGEKEKVDQLVELMWGNVQRPVNSVLAKLDMIFLGALSNCGVFSLTDDNNPEGAVRATINYGQPAENIAEASVSWDDANLDTAKTMTDIIDVIDAAADKVSFGKILISQSALSYLCKSKDARTTVWGKSSMDTAPLFLAGLNQWMESNGFPTFEVIKRQTRVQNGNVITPVTPWNGKNVVFVPDGELGVIKNSYANNELRTEPGVAYSNYGRIRVSQWGVGETMGSNGVEFTKAECYALPVITEMQSIYTLKTKN